MVEELFRNTDISPAPAEGRLVKALTFIDSVGVMEYHPKPDITAYETALLLELFVRMTLGDGTGDAMAWRYFLAQNILLRHFQPVLTAKS